MLTIYYLQMYNFSSSSWSYGSPMTLPHSFFACAVLPARDLVLVLSTEPGANEKRADIFDILANTWTVTGSSLLPRAGSSLITLGQRVFVIGGSGNGTAAMPTSTVEEYDPFNGVWNLVGTNLLQGRKKFAVLSLPAALFKYLPQGCKGVQ